ncbi:MAG: uroporphyrinogen decarboxylase family protein [Armatimonadota bacterium]|nr:uroporphyrinogen decarboxylase family protein [Armatimonadota bacterium]
MTKRERIQAAIHHKPVDRPPIAMWRHFPQDDMRAEKLAASTIAFYRQFDFDLLKVTPASGYYGDDWGLKAAYRPNREGTRTYLERPIKKAGDWPHLKVLDVTSGTYGRELRAIRLIAEEVGREVPILETIMSPLTIARTLSGDHALLRYLQENPEEVHAGLEIITEVTSRFVQECLAAGADGIFFATQCATTDYLSEEQYEEFGRPYDLRVLEAAAGVGCIILHLHGRNILFDLFTDYPVHIINWHDRGTWPPLEEARKRYSGCLLGGIDEQGTLSKGTPEEVIAEVKDSLRRTGGVGHILGPGCVIPLDTPQENIQAAVAAVVSQTPPR